MQSVRFLRNRLSAALLWSLFLYSQTAISVEQTGATAQDRGKTLALDLCQACHYFEGSEQAGTLGPPLVAMKARFPERQKLYAVIYDPQIAIKPHSMMPPFGRHELASDEEINEIIEYLYTK